MKIEIADSPEAYELVGAMMREYGERYGFDFTDPDWLAEITDPAAHYSPPIGLALLARIDDELAGVVAVRALGGDLCEMKRMFVRPPFRRRGIGRAMAIELMALAHGRLGYRRMQLDTPSFNERALALYRSLGFVEVDVASTHGHHHDDWTFMHAPLGAGRLHEPGGSPLHQDDPVTPEASVQLSRDAIAEL